MSALRSQRLAMLAILAGISACGQPSNAGLTEVRFVPSALDLGVIEALGPVEFTLELVNHSPASIQIVDVNTGCTCAIVAERQFVMQPGETTRLPFNRGTSRTTPKNSDKRGTTLTRKRCDPTFQCNRSSTACSRSCDDSTGSKSGPPTHCPSGTKASAPTTSWMQEASGWVHFTPIGFLGKKGGVGHG